MILLEVHNIGNCIESIINEKMKTGKMKNVKDFKQHFIPQSSNLKLQTSNSK